MARLIEISSDVETRSLFSYGRMGCGACLSKCLACPNPYIEREVVRQMFGLCPELSVRQFGPPLLSGCERRACRVKRFVLGMSVCVVFRFGRQMIRLLQLLSWAQRWCCLSGHVCEHVLAIRVNCRVRETTSVDVHVYIRFQRWSVEI